MIKIMQHYSLTTASHELSAIEMRIMAFVVRELKEDREYIKYCGDTSESLFSFTRIKINQADIVVSDNYSEVREALESLTKRVIEIKKYEATYFFNLVREFYYSDDKSTIEIDITAEIQTELIAIGKDYTEFGLEFLFRTKSKYAIRWYQIGCHWLNNGFFYISKDEIRELFKAQNKYKVHKDFQRWLITEPLKKVNKKSDINIDISKTHKKGRVIVGYTMFVASKKQHVVIQ